jgi:HK97 family phage major capsid protein
MPDLELKDLLEKQNKAFADFKEANDKRLKTLEAKGYTDPLLEEKVDKANDAITSIGEQIAALEKKMARPQGIAGGGRQEVEEHKAAFVSFLRKGREEGLRELETKAFNVTTEADGGYAVPEHLDTQVLSLMQNMSPMRGVCNVITVGTSDYKKLVNTHGLGSGWVDEDDARTETTTPSLAQVAAVMGELYANPMATQTSLDDLFFDVEGFLSLEIAEAFALAEGAAFVTGNGTKKPKGFLAYTQAATADSSRAFGTVEYVASGSSGAFRTASATVSPADDLLTLIHAMKSGLRAGAAWMLNSATLATARKWKAYSTGDYIWQPGLTAGQPSSLFGYPIVECEDMPDVGAGTTPIAFGNWRRAYTIVDRIGTRVLRDPYTNKPYVGFYTTKRVGGMLVDSMAVKLLKLSAS